MIGCSQTFPTNPRWCWCWLFLCHLPCCRLTVPERSGLLWHLHKSNHHHMGLKKESDLAQIPQGILTSTWRWLWSELGSCIGSQDGHTTFLQYFVIRKSHCTTQRYADCSILHHHSHPWLQCIKSPEYIWDIYKYLWLQADMTFSKSWRTCITEQNAHFVLTTGSCFHVKQGCSVPLLPSADP